MSIKYEMEAIIFLGGDENKIRDLSRHFKITLEDTLKIINELREEIKERGVNIEINGDVVYLTTNPKYGESISKYFEQENRPKKLSQASLETLSIIAYRQPISKPEIEMIRGVSVDRIVQNLEEKSLVRSCGRKEGGGRAKLYEVTDKFLAYLGIEDITELPSYVTLSSSFMGEDNENK